MYSQISRNAFFRAFRPHHYWDRDHWTPSVWRSVFFPRVVRMCRERKERTNGGVENLTYFTYFLFLFMGDSLSQISIWPPRSGKNARSGSTGMNVGIVSGFMSFLPSLSSITFNTLSTLKWTRPGIKIACQAFHVQTPGHCAKPWPRFEPHSRQKVTVRLSAFLGSGVDVVVVVLKILRDEVDLCELAKWLFALRWLSLWLRRGCHDKTEQIGRSHKFAAFPTSPSSTFTAKPKLAIWASRKKKPESSSTLCEETTDSRPATSLMQLVYMK